MNKKIILVICFFSTAVFCRSAEIQLVNFKPDREIEMGVENILIIQNTYILHQCIDISAIKINEMGKLVMRRDSVLELLSVQKDSVKIQFDADQDYIIQEFFKVDKNIIIFSYARKSGIKAGAIQKNYGFLKKIVDGWQLEAIGISESMLQDVLLKIKKSPRSVKAP